MNYNSSNMKAKTSQDILLQPVPQELRYEQQCDKNREWCRAFKFKSSNALKLFLLIFSEFHTFYFHCILPSRSTLTSLPTQLDVLGFPPSLSLLILKSSGFSALLTVLHMWPLIPRFQRTL